MYVRGHIMFSCVGLGDNLKFLNLLTETNISSLFSSENYIKNQNRQIPAMFQLDSNRQWHNLHPLCKFSLVKRKHV